MNWLALAVEGAYVLPKSFTDIDLLDVMILSLNLIGGLPAGLGV